VAVALALVAPGARAQTSTAPAPLAPKASILVDADTGAVLQALNVHDALLPASLTKIVTALTAVANLPANTTLTVSARAAGMPAHNMNMKEGQVWNLEDVLGALLVSSANDAGMALAERVSGSAEAFGTALEAEASRLGMADHPVLQDPSGLDDEFSVDGGNRISARDLAIAARAVLAEPRLAPIVAAKVYSFTGPDGVAHRLGNHNRLLKLYDGAIGMKTGYTKHAMHGLVAAATRNGRTMITVILGAPGDTYGPTAALLDAGFATPVTAERADDYLPAVPEATKAAVAKAAAPKQLGSPVAVVGVQHGTDVGKALGVVFKLMLIGLMGVALLRARVLLRKRQRARVRTERPTPRPVPKPRPVTATSALPAKRTMAAPRPAHPRPKRATHSAPKAAPKAAPQHRRRDRPQQEPARAAYDAIPASEIDPKLARRVEILARTGQVVN
jgi:D-alanyl-D-alanine carboxypeptidase (penicillin-binding protein 5/6)